VPQQRRSKPQQTANDWRTNWRTADLTMLAKL